MDGPGRHAHRRRAQTKRGGNKTNVGAHRTLKARLHPVSIRWDESGTTSASLLPLRERLFLREAKQMLPYSRILIVDDSRVTRLIVRGMLERAGYGNVDEAADGKEALALLGRRAYALVLSDWNMAPMSGLELLTAMRASAALSAIPFIMVTARSQKRFAEVARDRGATRYLEKPFGGEALIGCIRSVARDTRITA